MKTPEELVEEFDNAVTHYATEIRDSPYQESVDHARAQYEATKEALLDAIRSQQPVVPNQLKTPEVPHG